MQWLPRGDFPHCGLGARWAVALCQSSWKSLASERTLLRLDALLGGPGARGMLLLAVFAAIFFELGRFPAFFHAFYFDATLFTVVLAGMLLYVKLSRKF